MIDDIFSHLSNIDDHHKRIDAEFRRLCAEPCMKPAAPGDRVIVAIGLLSMGHPWVREEATVLEAGGSSVKVRMKDYRDSLTRQPKELWVHPALIVDVFGPAPDPEEAAPCSSNPATS